MAVGGGVGGGDGGGQGRQAGGEALLWTVMPASLTKRELTKGVLSGNPLLQVHFVGGGGVGRGFLFMPI